jgi:hypothetical protein
MLGKFAFFFLLAVSLTCFGQVTTIGGYATTSGPAILTTPISAADAPLVSTPDIALPGSGPAVGVPLSNTNTNDSRTATGPSIANPNAITPVVTESNANATANEAAGVTGEPATANSADQPFEFGIQQFGWEPASAFSNPVTSLGEIARKYRSQRHQAVRTFTNDSIARLSAVAFQAGPLSAAKQDQVASSTPESGTANEVLTSIVLPQSAPIDTLVAENRPPDLPQNDQDTEGPQGSEPRAQVSVTAAQQRHPVDDHSGTAPNTAETPGSSSNATGSDNGRPPQTRSSLPLFLLVGGLGIAGRVLFLLLR